MIDGVRVPRRVLVCHASSPAPCSCAKTRASGSPSLSSKDAYRVFRQRLASAHHGVFKGLGDLNGTSIWYSRKLGSGGNGDGMRLGERRDLCLGRGKRIRPCLHREQLPEGWAVSDDRDVLG